MGQNVTVVVAVVVTSYTSLVPCSSTYCSGFCCYVLRTVYPTWHKCTKNSFKVLVRRHVCVWRDGPYWGAPVCTPFSLSQNSFSCSHPLTVKYLLQGWTPVRRSCDRSFKEVRFWSELTPKTPASRKYCLYSRFFTQKVEQVPRRVRRERRGGGVVTHLLRSGSTIQQIVWG